MSHIIYERRRLLQLGVTVSCSWNIFAAYLKIYERSLKPAGRWDLYIDH